MHYALQPEPSTFVFLSMLHVIRCTEAESGCQEQLPSHADLTFTMEIVRSGEPCSRASATRAQQLASLCVDKKGRVQFMQKVL